MSSKADKSNRGKYNLMSNSQVLIISSYAHDGSVQQQTKNLLNLYIEDFLKLASVQIFGSTCYS